MDKMIYLYIISQKKPSRGVSKNWILLQDSDTVFLQEEKRTIDLKSHPFYEETTKYR